MKIFLLYIMVFTLTATGSVLSQTLDDYIFQVKNDTLVVKDYYDMENQPNSLYWVLTLDKDNVPAGRVYELKSNGYYPLKDIPTTLRNTIIVGEDNRILVNNNDAGSAPPLICGWESVIGFNFGGINFKHNLTIKNCNIVLANESGDVGWVFFDGQADNVKLTLQNCLLERTIWVFMSTQSKNISWHLKDCYFVNMSGHHHRRSDGVFHVFAPQDTLLVENCTHIMASGYLYRFLQYPFKRIIFNHNTFINCAGVIFQDFGYQSAFSTTNNIFVNCNVQPYCDVLASQDVFEFDPDTLAIGLVNTHNLPDSLEPLDRKYLFENNVIYWDPRLGDIVSTLNENNVNGVNDWIDQMVIMNERTQTMFEDDETYPYLTLGGNYTDIIPDFTDPKNLLADQVDSLRTFVIATVDTSGWVALPTWRLVSTDFIRSDWPIPVDLSYDNAELSTGATNDFPVGDLNWFPDKKIQWYAQREAEYDSIEQQLGPIRVSIEKDVNLIEGFKLQQNYPNPFNSNTNISYHLSATGEVTLKVYDILGREVTSLVNEKQHAGTHLVQFDGSSLASGIYFYRLRMKGLEKVRKMFLLK